MSSVRTSGEFVARCLAELLVSSGLFVFGLIRAQIAPTYARDSFVSEIRTDKGLLPVGYWRCCS